MPKYTDEQLENLTEEELAGLNDEDDEAGEGVEGEEETEQDDEADEGADEQDEEQDEEDGEEGEPDDEADADDDQADDEPADEGQPGRDDGQPTEEQDEPDPAENPDRPVVPEFALEAPKDVEAREADIDRREDELTEKFDDGDLSTAEYRKQLRALNKERDELTWEVRRYETAKDRHQDELKRAEQDYLQRWYSTAKDFVTSHPEINRNRTVSAVFDQLVQAINTNENINKFSHQQRLEMAYKQWREDLGMEPQAPAPKPKAKKADKPRRELPPTLAKTPAASVQETDTGEFGTLNRLFNSRNPNDVAKAEDMLAKMSEAEQDRFLRSN